MNRIGVNNYINSLQQQIDSSVDKIKQKSAAPYSSGEEQEKEDANGFGRRIESYAYRLLPGEISWSLGAESLKMADGAAHAAGSYQQAAEVMREPTIRIDLMFKNNREFDFKV